MAEIGKDLIVADELNVQVLFTPEGLKETLQGVRSKVMAHTLDVTTDKGRTEIASLAYKIARTKTLIDNLGKEIIADWQAKVNGINTLRKTSRDFLDNLKSETRNPLDEWEEEQKKIEEEKERNRKEKIQTRCELLSKYRGVVPISLIETMPDEEFDALLLDKKEAYEAEKAEQERVRKEQERIRKEQEAREAALEKEREQIRDKEAAIKKEEEEIERKRREQEAKEAALEKERELMKLKKIKAEKEAADKIEREKKEAAEREEFERQAKIKAEKEAADKIEREKKEAAEKVKREAELQMREAALKPDKELLRGWVESFSYNTTISLRAEEAKVLCEKIMEDFEHFLKNAIFQIDAL